MDWLQRGEGGVSIPEAPQHRMYLVWGMGVDPVFYSDQFCLTLPLEYLK